MTERLLSSQGVVLSGTAVDIDRQLREGDGLLWSGDPDLHLRNAFLVARKSFYSKRSRRTIRKGETFARSWEVWRLCEDGVERMILRVPLNQLEAIPAKLAPMRMGSGRAEDVLAKIDKHNADIEDRQKRRFQDVYGDMLEHAARVHHNNTRPVNVFSFAGKGKA